MNFDDFFISEAKPYKGKSKRDKFLSRVFGIFNEEIIRIWCRNENSPFEDCGRPTVYVDEKRYTLDFLLKDKDGNLYLTEMKCELEYQKYKFLKLSESSQVSRHNKKPAFKAFLETAVNPSSYIIKCKKEKVHVKGAVLIWGSIFSKEVENILKEYSLSYILSTEEIINNLIDWKDDEYISFVGQYKEWSNQLFTSMLEKNK